MTFTQAVRTGFSKYLEFRGRAGRPEFWWWCLFVFLVGIVTGFIDNLMIAPRFGYEPWDEDTPGWLSAFVSLLLFLPGLSVSVRRLHDVDRSGWWLLIIFIPLIGILVLLYWYVCRGTEGDNRFGPGPQRDAVLEM